MKKITAVLAGITAAGTLAIATPAVAETSTYRPSPTATPDHAATHYTCYAQDPRDSDKTVHWTAIQPCPTRFTSPPPQTSTEPAGETTTTTTAMVDETSTPAGVTTAPSATNSTTATEDQLPVTGNNMVVLLMVGAALMIAGLVAIAISRKRGNTRFEA